MNIKEDRRQEDIKEDRRQEDIKEDAIQDPRGPQKSFIIKVICSIVIVAIIAGILYGTYRRPSSLVVDANELMNNKIEDSTTNLWLCENQSVDFKVITKSSGLWGKVKSPVITISNQDILFYDKNANMLTGLQIGDSSISISFGKYHKKYNIKVVSEDEVVKATGVDLDFLEMLREDDGYGWMVEGEEQLLYCTGHYSAGSYRNEIAWSYESTNSNAIEIKDNMMIAKSPAISMITCLFGDIGKTKNIKVYPCSKKYTLSASPASISMDARDGTYSFDVEVNREETIDYSKMRMVVFLNGDKLSTTDISPNSYIISISYSGWTDDKDICTIEIYLNQQDLVLDREVENKLTFCLLGYNEGVEPEYSKDILDLISVEINCQNTNN